MSRSAEWRRESPAAPYARSGGIVSVRVPPTFIPFTPWSHPGMTSPAPRRNSNGSFRSRELSNFVPSMSVPV